MRPGRSTGHRGAVSLLTIVGLFAFNIPTSSAQSSSEIAAQIQRAQDEIERLDHEKDLLDEDALVAMGELTQVQADIATAAARVSELEVKLGDIAAEVSEFAMNTFVSGDQTGGIGSLLTGGGADLTQTVEREQYTKLALSAGESATDQLDSTVNDLNKAREQLAKKQKQAEQLIQEIADKRKATEEKAVELVAFKQAQKVKYGAALAAEEAAREERLAREAATAIANAQAKKRASGGGNTGGTSRGGANPGGSAGGSTGGSSSGGGNTPPPPSPGASGAVAAARSQLGVPYKFATSNPGVSFDCSGLTAWAWGQAGVSLPHQSRMQYASIPHVDPADVQVGDLIFDYNPISHVGIYIGGGQMIHAPNTGSFVKISGVNWSKVSGVGRPG